MDMACIACVELRCIHMAGWLNLDSAWNTPKLFHGRLQKYYSTMLVRPLHTFHLHSFHLHFVQENFYTNRIKRVALYNRSPMFEDGLAAQSFWPKKP